jgi:hypothetical protein
MSSLPPPRPELPTLPYDLSEYARIHTGPSSWSANSDDAEWRDDAGLAEIALANAVGGPLLDVRTTDVPRVTLSPEECAVGSLDHREGFILSLLDGASDVETLLDIAGMPAAEALAVLCDLCARGIVTLEARAA